MRGTTRRASRTHLLLACTAAAAAVAVAVPGTAQAAVPGGVPSVLEVNTQFWDLPSPVTAASGEFAGCTSAVSLAQAPTRAPQFNGRKLVTCEGGTLQIVFQAAFKDGSVTGTWSASSGTGRLAGVRGTGTVTGTADCTLLDGSEGCVHDTWTGVLFRAP